MNGLEWHFKRDKKNKFYRADKFGNFIEYNFNQKVAVFKVYKIEGDKVYLKQKDGKQYLKIDNRKIFQSKSSCAFVHTISNGGWI